mgnify:CR=1 FL=1
MRIPYCLVKWKDTQAGPGWRRRDDAEKWADSPGPDHLSLGFRLPIGPPGDIVLAQSIQSAPNGAVGELLHIPKSAVRSVKTLGKVDH